MTQNRAAYVALVVASLVVSAVADAQAPPIGAAARFQADELGPGWHRGFVNQLRTVPPCYIVVTFEPRSSPEEPLRVKHTIPITNVQRLQIATAPGTSMQESQGVDHPGILETDWQEVELVLLQPTEGQCRSEKH